ncbi:hypothetical protein [Maribacter ulvicola]|uniref:Uncharacterized protein n=1 Tax=Maribacter ulvicola TaxID=228959 RepID=A0A1N6ZIL6_9FLAO|nr:hypothetical protein [Maribacter ulvicola]SIR26740.1 hypothetical protein SAMN05421797_1092 [Maribacter ulvicola]
MRKLLTYILIFTFCLGCSEKNTKRKSEINATIFFGAKSKNEKFNLTFDKTDNSLNYKYVNQIDTSKTILIRKIIQSDSLLFGFEKFLKADKESYRNKKLSDLGFEFYVLENLVTDGTGPILFNSDYGLLAINNDYGPTLIFLNKEDNEFTEQILTALNE